MKSISIYNKKPTTTPTIVYNMVFMIKHPRPGIILYNIKGLVHRKKLHIKTP